MEAKPCAYCGKRAVHEDHVLARQLVKRYEKDAARYGLPSIPAKWLVTVPSCAKDNWRKLTSRLVPPSWAGEVDALNDFFPGVKFRVFDGGKIPEATR